MQRFELFSKRNKTFHFDVLEYDSMPDKLRNQIYYIWKFALALPYANTRPTYGRYPEPVKAFHTIRETLCREHGLSSLYPRAGTTTDECEMYLKHGKDINLWLDLVELSMRMIKPTREAMSWEDRQLYEMTLNTEDAIGELNDRFRENGIGYEFSNGILIRKDSEYLHQEATKPALHLLQAEEFDGAFEEFLGAHDHFRKGNYKESIVNASKAFESTMKTICARRDWAVNGSGNAAQLIRAIVDNELIPSYLQTHVNSLKTTLEGLPSVRNNEAGHGQGETSMAVPEHFVNYALHLCGTNIVLLIEAYKALPEKN